MRRVRQPFCKLLLGGFDRTFDPLMPAIRCRGEIRFDLRFPIGLRRTESGGGLLPQVARGAFNFRKSGACLFHLSANALFEFLNARDLSLRGLSIDAGTLRRDLRPQIGGLLLQSFEAFLDLFLETLLEGSAAFLFELFQLGCQLLHGALGAFCDAAVKVPKEGIDLKLLHLLKGLFGSRAGSRFE